MGPVNIGSEEMVTINELVDTAARVAGKDVRKIHIDGPLGVRGRNSNNDVIRRELGWDYSQSLEEGISITYNGFGSNLMEKIERVAICTAGEPRSLNYTHESINYLILTLGSMTYLHTFQNVLQIFTWKSIFQTHT